MSVFNKISWQDGMFLYPQHFQQQDLYFEKLISKYYLLSPMFNFGLLDVEIDEDALLMNKIAIKRCIGILPDGTLFNAPNNDPLPLPISVPEGYNNDFVYLGLAFNNLTNDKADDLRNKRFRYFTSYNKFFDTHLEQLETKEILISRLNLQILLSTEDLNVVSNIPILKIHSTLNAINLDREYIPPVLRVQSSSVLENYVNKIIALLSSYINVNLRFLGHTSVTKYIKKVENLLLFQTIYKYKQLFLLFSKDSHLLPYTLFERILEMISSIGIFVEDNKLEEIKIQYYHQNLWKSFSPLIELVEYTFTRLNNKTAIKLDFEYKNNLHVIEIPEGASIDNMEFIISIELKDKNNKPTALLDKIKIGTIEGIRGIIAAQVSGIKCTLMNTVPPYVSYIEHAIYGQIVQEGQNWSQILEKRNLAIYTSSDIAEIKHLSLWIISK